MATSSASTSASELERRKSPKDAIALGASVCRVAAAVVTDKLSKPVPRVRSDVPAHVRCITPNWLTNVLQSALPGSTVEAVSFDGESSGTSVRARLHLSYRNGGQGRPATMFAKSTPTFTTRIANGLTATAPTEAGFYRELRPQLNLEAPIGYHSAFDAKSWRSIQIIEDLVATKDASFCSPAHVVSAGQAEQIVRQLAALHAQAMRIPAVVGKRPQWLRTYPDWWRRSMSVVGVKRSHLRAMTAAIENGLIPIALKGREQETWHRFLQSVDDHRELPQTLIHGDVHLGNWYATADGDMGLCDWQCISVGHWSRDLAYALSSALEVEQRRAWERDLIQAYLDELHEAGGPRTGFAEAWNLYRRQLPAALMMWTPTYRPPPFMPDMQPTEVTEAMLTRICTAIVDLEALSA